MTKNIKNYEAENKKELKSNKLRLPDAHQMWFISNFSLLVPDIVQAVMDFCSLPLFPAHNFSWKSTQTLNSFKIALP